MMDAKLKTKFETLSETELLAALSTPEKVELLAGQDWWRTIPVPRLGIPSIKTSDGPNGARGSTHFRSTPSTCIPCATALGATFDVALLEKAGELLAREVGAKSGSMLLAPTVNIQRSPLGGRSFESYSEDPWLSGTLAAALINGLQQTGGIGACIKHFVCNDQEEDRLAVDAIVDARPLREIYLMPFMIALQRSKPWAFMTSYARLNGIHCAEDKWLLQDLLRGEWGFDGLVMSDWFGTYSTSEAINAGLDLEMPGPTRWRKVMVTHAIAAKKITLVALDARVKAILQLAKRSVAAHPSIVYNPVPEQTLDNKDDKAFNRLLASSSIVLLKNELDVLPIDASKIKSIAIIGPNSRDPSIYSGGGSAALKASYVVTTFEGIKAALPAGVEVHYEVGCHTHKFLPSIADIKTLDGTPGYTASFYVTDPDEGGQSVASYTLTENRVRLNDNMPEGVTGSFYLLCEGYIVPETDGTYEFSLCVVGRGRLFVNDTLVVDNFVNQRPGDAFYGGGSADERATFQLKAGVATKITVRYQTSDLPVDGKIVPDELAGRSRQPGLIVAAMQFGMIKVIDEEEAIAAAAALAARCDAAVVITGLNSAWESEGFDRPSLALPGRTNDLVSAVLAANPRSVIVNQSGSAVTFPWVKEAATLVQSMYLGNEGGNAVADVLFGKVNPSGRLPLTFPVRDEDVPAYLDYSSQNGRVNYSEGLYVGYKWYDARLIAPQFAFGYGLSYTRFELQGKQVSATVKAQPTLEVTISVEVTNVGTVAGAEAALLYVLPPKSRLQRPKQELKGFAKTNVLAAGASQKLDIHLDKQAFSYWDDAVDAWVVEAGKYDIIVKGGAGKSAVSGQVVLDGREFSWTGLA